MKVFDFDDTIYDGESSFDFFKFCLKKKKSLIRYMPSVISKAMKYKSGELAPEDARQFADKMVKVFFDNCRDLDVLVREFWSAHAQKLMPHMLDKISPDDAVISASPRFLFEGIKDRLPTKNIICTELDEENKTLALFCHGDNKLTSFRDRFGSTPIDEVYTDSLDDLPLINAAEKAFLVDKGEITQIK